MKTAYQTDVVAWANEQAAFIRQGKFDQLDLEHLAEEIEDVGKSEQRELASRMAVLLAHLLKYKFQPERNGSSWQSTINNQRKRIALRLKNTPSLKTVLSNQDWQTDIWLEAVDIASKETNIHEDIFPEQCLWDMADVLKEGWLPGE